MYPTRLGLWVLGIAFVGLFIAGTGPSPLLIFLGPLLIGLAESYASRRRQREWLAKTWGTYENFRASVDTAALRELKYSRGYGAVRWQLKRQYPRLAPKQARALISEL